MLINGYKIKISEMETLKYKIIKSKKQYLQYCNLLQALVDDHAKGKRAADEIELLSFLIKKWDDEHDTFQEQDPIALLKYLMKENNLKAKDLVAILGISKGLVSEILNYKKGLSKEVIRLLAAHFKLSQEAFNRPYKLTMSVNLPIPKSRRMLTTKKLLKAPN